MSDTYDAEADFLATGSVVCGDCGARVWPKTLASLPVHGCTQRQRMHHDQAAMQARAEQESGR